MSLYKDLKRAVELHNGELAYQLVRTGITALTKWFTVNHGTIENVIAALRNKKARKTFERRLESAITQAVVGVVCDTGSDGDTLKPQPLAPAEMDNRYPNPVPKE